MPPKAGTDPTAARRRCRDGLADLPRYRADEDDPRARRAHEAGEHDGDRNRQALRASRARRTHDGQAEEELDHAVSELLDEAPRRVHLPLPESPGLLIVLIPLRVDFDKHMGWLDAAIIRPLFRVDIGYVPADRSRLRVVIVGQIIGPDRITAREVVVSNPQYFRIMGRELACFGHGSTFSNRPDENKKAQRPYVLHVGSSNVIDITGRIAAARGKEKSDKTETEPATIIEMAQAKKKKKANQMVDVERLLEANDAHIKDLQSQVRRVVRERNQWQKRAEAAEAKLREPPKPKGARDVLIPEAHGP